MTEISIENQNDKNIDKNSSEENSTDNQTKKQNNDLLKNEVKPNDNIIEYTSSEQSNIVNPTKCKLYMFVGRTLFIFFDKYSNPIFIIGPHWPMIIFVISIISIPMLLLYLNYQKVFFYLNSLNNHLMCLIKKTKIYFFMEIFKFLCATFWFNKFLDCIFILYLYSYY